jgi:SAM-dependent methyltransferase
VHDFTWTWDPTLYAGSAEHYADGRRPYPPALAGAIRDALGLDGTGRLLDVGCGPGALTTLLAPLFAEARGGVADPGMIRVARERAPEITWRELRAEELPAGLGRFRAITFAQSFHWMDQPVVARAARDMLTPDGAWVHVHATTHRGVGGDNPPPWDEIQDLVRSYLGPEQRAGQGTLPTGTRGREEDVMRAEGWAGPARLEVEQPGRWSARSTRWSRPCCRSPARRRTCSATGCRRSSRISAVCCTRRRRPVSSPNGSGRSAW